MYGQAQAVLDLSGAKPGKYFYSVDYRSDGSITIKQIPNVVVVGNDTQPVPAPPPFNPTPLPPSPIPSPPIPVPPINPPIVQDTESQVQQSTLTAVRDGGSVTTAVCLQRVYYIISSSANTDQLAPGKVLSTLKSCTDIALAETNEGGKWDAWRSSVSTVLTSLQEKGKLKNKEDFVEALTRIENGLKNTINTLSDANPGLQDRIDYNIVLKVQQKSLQTVKGVK